MRAGCPARRRPSLVRQRSSRWTICLNGSFVIPGSTSRSASMCCSTSFRRRHRFGRGARSYILWEARNPQSIEGQVGAYGRQFGFDMLLGAIPWIGAIPIISSVPTPATSASSSVISTNTIRKRRSSRPVRHTGKSRLGPSLLRLLGHVSARARRIAGRCRYNRLMSNSTKRAARLRGRPSFQTPGYLAPLCSTGGGGCGGVGGGGGQMSVARITIRPSTSASPGARRRRRAAAAAAAAAASATEV